MRAKQRRLPRWPQREPPVTPSRLLQSGAADQGSLHSHTFSLPSVQRPLGAWQWYGQVASAGKHSTVARATAAQARAAAAPPIPGTLAVPLRRGGGQSRTGSRAPCGAGKRRGIAASLNAGTAELRRPLHAVALLAPRAPKKLPLRSGSNQKGVGGCTALWQEKGGGRQPC